MAKPDFCYSDCAFYIVNQEHYLVFSFDGLA